MNKSVFALIVLTMTLTACGSTGGTGKDEAKSKSQKEQQVAASSFVGDYQAYSSTVVGNGESSVLFFYAAWCPTCQDKDSNLHDWYSAAEFPVKTYRADFDTEDALKKRYGITMQDTFVLIDGTGKTIKKEVSPSLSELKRLLYANVDEAQAKDSVQEVVKDAPEAPTAVASDSSYTQYTPGVIGNGKESVLFFHATWCPKCKENDGRLKDFYGSADFSRSVYKIDYDTATDLKSQFGITGQDTFVLIDGNGNEISRTRFPSKDALRDLLG